MCRAALRNYKGNKKSAGIRRRGNMRESALSVLSNIPVKFDLRDDPHQMKNVAADPAYAAVVAQLRQRLMSELKRTADPRLTDDGRYFETPPLAGPIPSDANRPKR